MEEVKLDYTQKALERYNTMVFKQNAINQDANTIAKLNTLLNWCNANHKLLWDYLEFSFEQYAIDHEVIL